MKQLKYIVFLFALVYLALIGISRSEWYNSTPEYDLTRIVEGAELGTFYLEVSGEKQIEMRFDEYVIDPGHGTEFLVKQTRFNAESCMRGASVSTLMLYQDDLITVGRRYLPDLEEHYAGDWGGMPRPVVSVCYRVQSLTTGSEVFVFAAPERERHAENFFLDIISGGDSTFKILSSVKFLEEFEGDTVSPPCVRTRK